ncbi:MAG: hypothetical protein EAX96_12450 [Candidatus Lokiarchaeota archaeon]|nr:hypothetical protein [Candidatus Lokiarchaeota archaeon]
MFRLENFKELSDLEKKIFYEVISSEYGVSQNEIAEMARRFKTTEEKVEDIILKLELDGYFGSNSTDYN